MDYKNPNHPAKGSSTKVEPTRTKKAIDIIKKMLKLFTLWNCKHQQCCFLSLFM